MHTGQLKADYYAGAPGLLLIVGGYCVVSLAYFYISQHYPEKLKALLFTLAFHVLALLFMLFVSGFLSSFLAVWIILLVDAHIFFGWPGFTMSLLGLAVAGGLSVAIRPHTPLGELYEIIQGTIAVGAIGYLVARIRSAVDKERSALIKTRDQESFQRERLLALVNSMGDAVVTTDEEGSIKIYNAAFASLLDTNRALVGKNLDSVLRLKDPKKRLINILDDARTIHRVFSRTDLSHHFSDDDVIRLYINVAPIQPGYLSKTERGYIFIVRDITKEKTLEEERDEFIAVISHELRTPVAIAEGNLSNLQLLQERGATPAVLQHAIRDAHEQIIYLAKIINDLGTLSRAERGINIEGTEAIDTAQLLSELYKTYLPMAQKTGIRFDLDIAPHLAHIRTSRSCLEEILQNIIINAFKYTHEGSVTLIGQNTKTGVYLAVKDTGIGIGKTDQRHIFEKFYRSEDYRTRETTGTGLGLYISKKLADTMNLQISFESRLNHGSVFGVTLKAIDKK